MNGHPAQFQGVVRPLNHVDVGPHHPVVTQAVERSDRQVGVHEAQRLARHLPALREVGLDADGVDQRIELGVRITARVERARSERVIGVNERVQDVPRVGARRPAELDQTAARLRQFRKKIELGDGTKLVLMPTFSSIAAMAWQTADR